MKSTGLIFQDFSIAGLIKQWEWQEGLKKLAKEKNLPELSDGGYLVHYKDYAESGLNPLGCKTETRRTRGLDKINEGNWVYVGNSTEFEVPREAKKGNDGILYVFEPHNGNHMCWVIKCPYGKVGDEIYVKETWCVNLDVEGEYLYKQKSPDACDPDEDKSPWKSPIYMPKAASRILLEITGIKIERLWEITEEGALREGIYSDGVDHVISTAGEKAKIFELGSGNTTVYSAPHSAVNLYKHVWKELHGQESWDKNPWVWVIQFKVKEFKS